MKMKRKRDNHVVPGVSGVDLNLADFTLWSPLALKQYLNIRKKSVEGTFEELAARAFIAWEEGIPIDPTKEQAQRSNLEEYRAKLKIEDVVLPDPFTINGWLDESAMCRWPKLYFTDISEYLRLKTPQELYYRLCNEYKQGKAYRYFTSGWVKKICYHSISTTSKICFLTAKVSASMRTSMPPYQVWAAIEKDTPSFAGGRIFSAYCTCTAGLHGSCNHIAGLLFRVECAVRTGMTSCTSQACTWNVPRDMKSISKPTPLKDLVWKKDQYFNQDGDDTFAQSVKVLATKFTPMTAPQKEYIDSDQSTTDLSSKLRSINPNCCFMQLYDEEKPLAEVGAMPK
ncbi:uncharacterized protein LOC594793 isoform X3 [Strongylocentrotus purpuratus]|uniref:SWIM-type domain-containing protein n=1 Tax=Strongylocentrotus purpuratus TaxID=7668 RepID=A0A7M7RHM8_STRPU|nr:uncharacterized protein LOC594793 isoform X3 [Strongylocentrotus purpuratus]